MNVVIASRQRARKINRRLLKRITTALLADLKIENAELGIHLVAAAEMTLLNEKFLRHAGSTDVITFDYAETVAQASRLPRPSKKRLRTSRDGCATLHGDIFVCMDEAVRQARTFGTSWQSETVRYVVHGLLHLLGHDDRRANRRRKMKREENRRVRELSHRFPLSKL
jgi:probable rRNA maturation factor